MPTLYPTDTGLYDRPGAPPLGIGIGALLVWDSVVGFGVGTFLVWVWVLVNFGRPWRGHYITLETPHLGPRKLLMKFGVQISMLAEC